MTENFLVFILTMVLLGTYWFVVVTYERKTGTSYKTLWERNEKRRNL